MIKEPEVIFNMDLANGPTSERFCYEAAAVLGLQVLSEDAVLLRGREDTEAVCSIVDEWTTQLEDAGYCVWWNAGDVVVWDLRPLTEAERGFFLEELETI